MADVSGLVILLALGAVLDLIRKGMERKAERQRQSAPRPLPSGVVLPTGTTGARVRGDWRRALEEAGPFGRHPDHPLESDEDVEERESLEAPAPEVRSLEAPVVRAPRVVVDLDDESRLTVARRLKEAAARDRAHTRADHRSFDRTIRQVAAAPAPERQPPTRAQLREAMKWREILDRPVGWRDE